MTDTNTRHRQFEKGNTDKPHIQTHMQKPKQNDGKSNTAMNFLKKTSLLQESDPSSSELGSWFNTWNELSEETHMLTKQETLLGKGTQGKQ